MYKKIDLSIVAPVYNEALNIKNTLKNWDSYLRNCKYLNKYEIILTDDGSSDGTLKILKKIKLKIKNLTLYSFSKNKGPGAALKNSIKKSNYKFILTLDSDGQFNIRDLKKLYIELNKKNSDLVIGNRKKKQDIIFMVFGSWISSCLANYFMNTKIKDFNSNFKLVKSNLLKNLSLQENGMNYSGEITAKLVCKKIKFSNVYITHSYTYKKKKLLSIFKHSLQRFIFVSKLIKYKFNFN